MSKKAPIGFIKCFCGFPDGEIRLDKNENPYYYCPDCSIQVLTHGGTRGAMFKAKMRPVDLAVNKTINETDKKNLKKEVEQIMKPVPAKKPDQDKKPVPVEKTSIKKPTSSLDEPPKKETPKKPAFGMLGGNS